MINTEEALMEQSDKIDEIIMELYVDPIVGTFYITQGEIKFCIIDPMEQENKQKLS